jgi:hypothetical protein
MIAMGMRALILCAASLGWVVAADCQDKVADVASLIGQLSDTTFGQRQAAMQGLAQAGLAAIPSLSEALFDSSPEVRWRAAKSLEQIGVSGDEPTMRKVSRIMAALAQAGVGDFGEKGRRLRENWVQTRLTSLGAVFESRVEGVGGMMFVDGDFGEIPERPAVDIATDRSQPSQPLDVEGLRAEIERILADDERSDRAAMAQIEADSRPSEAQTDDSEARRAADLVERRAILAGFAPAQGVTINRDWSGNPEDLDLLRQVKDLQGVTLIQREITSVEWDTLASIPTLTSLKLERCQYDVDQAVEFRRVLPEVYIRVVGHGFLGVMGPLDVGDGPCVLSQVLSNSGAEQAGLQADDEIIAIDGAELQGFRELTLRIGALRPGDKVRIEYRRGGKTAETTVVLRERTGIE